MTTEKNERVTMDVKSEDADRFGYVPPNRMTTQDDVEKRGYVPPSVEREPVVAAPSIESLDIVEKLAKEYGGLVEEIEGYEAILRDAGFTDIELFYAALTFKGWVCRKA